MDKGKALVLAYALAGAVVYTLARLTYWRSKAVGVPALLAGAPARALELGLALGTGAAALGMAYLVVLHRTPWWEAHLREAAGVQIKVHWMFLLAVVAAPLCEEFIFRGLLFGGLRRSMSFLPAAALSAALFAIVHPAVSIVPVFALGMCTAYAYERGKGLLAPMLVHAIYNGAVVAFQLFT
jgi:membrane protease YdiL (CAAX protease family)